MRCLISDTAAYTAPITAVSRFFTVSSTYIIDEVLIKATPKIRFILGGSAVEPPTDYQGPRNAVLMPTHSGDMSGIVTGHAGVALCNLPILTTQHTGVVRRVGAAPEQGDVGT